MRSFAYYVLALVAVCGLMLGSKLHIVTGTTVDPLGSPARRVFRVLLPRETPHFRVSQHFTRTLTTWDCYGLRRLWWETEGGGGPSSEPVLYGGMLADSKLRPPSVRFSVWTGLKLWTSGSSIVAGF